MRLPNPIRVIVTDDNPHVRASLAVFLDTCEDIVRIGEAHNGRKAVELCEILRPDVVLMDMMMPEMDGITATQLIRGRFPATAVIMLTNSVDMDLIARAREAGAAAVLPKNTPIDDLADAIYATDPNGAT